MDETDPGPALRPARVFGWTLLGALTGAVAAAALLFLWSEASGAGQDLGFIQVQLDYALAGSVAGALAGLLCGLAREFQRL